MTTTLEWDTKSISGQRTTKRALHGPDRVRFPAPLGPTSEKHETNARRRGSDRAFTWCWLGQPASTKAKAKMSGHSSGIGHHQRPRRNATSDPAAFEWRNSCNI